MRKEIIFLFIFLISCSSLQGPHNPYVSKEFSKGEVILATQLLTKIFDSEMAPLACIQDTDEASLLLRAIHPRMEVIQDDLEALLDNPEEVEKLIKECSHNCTCSYVDDLFREHLVILSKEQQRAMNKNKSQKEINRCMSFAQDTFCKSELYLELNKEKADFSFEE